MEKAIFPRDNKEKNTVSELLPKLNDDAIDNNLDILMKSSIVDGTKISGNGIVKNHTYRWKMAVESGVKSIAQVPDRFFDIQGRSYPIDWNRKISATSLPTYKNYKDAIIYKINSCDQIQIPKAKIIYDEAMESNRINLVYNLQSIFADDEINIVNLTVNLPKANSDSEYDTFTYKDVIVLNKDNKTYAYADEELYSQQLVLIKEVAYSANHLTDENRTYKNVDTITSSQIKADGVTLQKQGKFYEFRNEIPSVTDENFLGTFFNRNNMIEVEEVKELTLAELQELYNGIGVITKKDIDFNIPSSFSSVTNTYSYNTPADTFSFKDIICLTKGEGTAAVEGILIDDNFISQVLSFVWSANSIEQENTSAFIKMLTAYYQFIEGDYLNKFYTFNINPSSPDSLLAGFLGVEFDTKYYNYLSEDLSKALSNGNIVSSYLQNHATTSLFTNLKDYSLIPDELGSIENNNIPYEEIKNANYLAIIIDNNNDYHALIGITKNDLTYLNTAYDDALNPITWYKPKVAVDVSQFKGLDMWLRFQSINEMIYFLITKYERDIEDILPANINANENKILWGSGNGTWAVNKQVTTTEENEDLESVKKQGKLWAYVNPRTMTPYEDDYWFHQGEPIYIKSLTIAPKNKKLKANRITIKADQWPGMYMMIGETYIRSRDTGEDERMQIKFPLCKVKSDQTLTLEADGDPTTFNIDLEVARPASGAMMEITSYEIAQKLYEGDNGCFYAVDGSTEVLSE